jgi:DNA invertase Pin-like site-specific DNA recombinase
VAEVSLGHVGIILCFEASRLSRNSKDWAQLFELCGHLATLVADLDQVYDLALPGDRLILGVKGTVSEYELSLFRQRSQEAIAAKAKRGELTFTLPAGLGWTADDRIELNPDRRVQQAIQMVFAIEARRISIQDAVGGSAVTVLPTTIRPYNNAGCCYFRARNAKTSRLNDSKSPRRWETVSNTIESTILPYS